MQSAVSFPDERQVYLLYLHEIITPYRLENHLTCIGNLRMIILLDTRLLILTCRSERMEEQPLQDEQMQEDASEDTSEAKAAQA